MKNKFLFKIMIDILYITFLLAFIALTITISFSLITGDRLIIGSKPFIMLHDEAKVGIFPIIIALFNIASFALFLRGLYFLRKVAHFILQNRLFDKELIKTIKIAGKHFLYTGIIHFGTLIIIFIGRLTNGKLNLAYDINFMIPCFLVIIGLFFVIQSEALMMAKGFKEENELTV